MSRTSNIPPSKKNVNPFDDGDAVLYENKEAVNTSYFSHTQRAIFINGMGNTPKNHNESASTLSLLLMMPVIGIYNKTSGFIPDLFQCALDKYQFDGPGAPSALTSLKAKKGFSDFLDYVMGQQKKTAVEIMEDILSRNPPALTAFHALRHPQYKTAPIYAHSQGNLILSNALSAVAAVDGPQAIAGRKVFSYGSPTVNWPEGIVHQENAFTGDPVALLSGIDWGFNISKVGSYPKILKQDTISHGFLLYLRNDPAFVVNRFRWGGWGLTVSLDEKGLAEALISMGKNLQRVEKIFEYLYKHHYYDVDDVALIYTQILKSADKYANIDALSARSKLRFHKSLKSLLIKAMAEGYTSNAEEEAIKYLRRLS